MGIKYNVIIADDHPIFRDGFRSFLNNQENIGDIYEAANGKIFIDLLKTNKIDLAFMDINMPEKDGFETTKEAIHIQPDIKIIGVSAFQNIDYIDKMLNLGAMGYILKDSGKEEIIQSLNKVMVGDYYFSNRVLAKLSQRVIVNQHKTTVPEITEREQDVLNLLCRGASRFEIAGKLYISERTVDKHRENLQQKTQTHNVVKLVLYAFKNGLVDYQNILS